MSDPIDGHVAVDHRGVSAFRTARGVWMFETPPNKPHEHWLRFLTADELIILRSDSGANIALQPFLIKKAVDRMMDTGPVYEGPISAHMKVVEFIGEATPPVVEGSVGVAPTEEPTLAYPSSHPFAACPGGVGYDPEATPPWKVKKEGGGYS